MTWLRWIFGTLLLGAIWCVAYLGLEFPSEWLYPATVLGAAMLAGGGVIAAMTLRRHNSVLRCVVFVALCAGFMGCLTALNDRPISRFRTAYHSIRVGMTAAEVDAVMARNFPGRKPEMGWDLEQQRFFAALVTLDPTLSEAFDVQLESGKVVKKGYVTD